MPLENTVLVYNPRRTLQDGVYSVHLNAVNVQEMATQFHNSKLLLNPGAPFGSLSLMTVVSHETRRAPLTQWWDQAPFPPPG